MSVVRTAYFFTGVCNIFHENVNLLCLAEYKVVPSQSSVCRKISVQNVFHFVTLRETFSHDELGKKFQYFIWVKMLYVWLVCVCNMYCKKSTHI